MRIFLASLVKKLEGIFKFDIAYVVKSNLYLILPKVALSLAGFGVVFCFTHFASKELYGQFNYIASILGTLAVFSLPGMQTAMVQASAVGQDGILKTGTGYRIRYSVIGSLLLFAFAGYSGIISRSNSDLWKTFLLCAFLFPLAYATDGYLYFINGKKLFKALAFFDIATSTLPLVILSFFIIKGSDLLTLYSVKFISALLIQLSLLIWVYTRFTTNQNCEGESIRFGKEMSFLSVIFSFYAYLDSLIVGTIFGFKDLAVFSIGRLISQSLKMVFWGLSNQFLVPYLAQLKAGEARSLVHRHFKTILLGAVVSSFCLIALLPWAVPFLFTLQYSESVFIAQLLILSIVISVPGMLYDCLFRAHKKTRNIFLIQVGHILPELLLLPLFLLRFGFMGVVYARLVTISLYSLIGWYLMRRMREE
jgi:O-antigen/teichoic acid export membrane protein